MIVSSGYSIYPSQLENVLDAHEAVQLSCVIGVPHPYKIQAVKAFLVLRPGVADTPALREALWAHCRGNIARYALPKEIEIRDKLPTTLVGKVAYTVLEQEEAAKQSF
jgi:long-chain acyl-CoA synthetase